MDDVRDALLDHPITLVKIDVEGSELEVLRGMQQILKETGACVLCEVLHRDRSADPEEYRARLGRLSELLLHLNYEAHRIVQAHDGKELTGLLHVASFPDVCWHDGSEFECDYLFIPAGQSAAAREALLA